MPSGPDGGARIWRSRSKASIPGRNHRTARAGRTRKAEGRSLRQRVRGMAHEFSLKDLKAIPSRSRSSPSSISRRCDDAGPDGRRARKSHYILRRSARGEGARSRSRRRSRSWYRQRQPTMRSPAFSTVAEDGCSSRPGIWRTRAASAKTVGRFVSGAKIPIAAGSCGCGGSVGRHAG